MLAVYKTHFSFKDKRVKEQKKKMIFQANDKIQGVAILIIEKINFKYVKCNKDIIE